MYFATGAAFTAAINALPTSLTGTYKAFDSFYYAGQYMGVYTGSLSPVEHFVQIGAARGYKPNAEFDPTYYQSKYADLANLDAADLVFHYVKSGLNEGRVGNATLASYNWAGYLSAYPDVAAYVTANLASFGGNTTNGAIAHYVKFGAVQGFVVPGSVAGKPLLLTTGVDTTLVGGAGDDTYTASGTTLTAGDVLSGSTGNDTLQITTTAEASVGAGVNSTGVETISATATVGALTVNASSFTGVTAVTNNGSTTDVSVTGLTSKVAAVNLTGSNASTTITHAAAAVVGTADALALTLNAANTTTSGTLTANGFETINAVATGSTGSSSTALTISDDSLQTLAITGAGASAIVATLGGASGAVVGTVTGGDGAETLTITPGSSALLSISTNAGNDRVNISSIAATHTIAGGDGTDTLNTSAAITTVTGANISGFETVRIASGATVALPATNTVATLTIADAGGGTLTNLAASGTVNLTTGGAATVTNTAGWTGATDAITVNVGAASGTGSTGQGTATLVGAALIETATINNLQASTDITGRSMGVTGSALKTMTVVSSGTAPIIITGGSATTLTTVDASGVNGAVTNSATMISTAGYTVKTGAGADAISGGLFGDTLDGGAGNDTLTGGVGADSMTGGAGADTFVFTANATGAVVSSQAAPDTIVGFTTGTDKISGTSAATYLAGPFATFTQGNAAALAAGGTNVAFFSTTDATLYIQATAGTQAALDTAIYLPGVTSFAATDLALGTQGTGNTVSLSLAAANVSNTLATGASGVTSVLDDGISTTGLLLIGSSINGGAGSDTLTISTDPTGAAAANAAVTLVTRVQGIENISLTAGNLTNALTMPSTAGLTVTNASATVGSIVTLGATGDGQSFVATGAGANTVILGGGAGNSATITGSAGIVQAVTLGAARQSASTGAGNDTISSTLAFAAGSTFAMGAGTSDTLTISTAGEITLAAAAVVGGASAFSGVETVVLTDISTLNVTPTAALAVTQGAGATTVAGTGTGGTITVAVNGANALTLSGDSNFAVTAAAGTTAAVTSTNTGTFTFTPTGTAANTVVASSASTTTAALAALTTGTTTLGGTSSWNVTGFGTGGAATLTEAATHTSGTLTAAVAGTSATTINLNAAGTGAVVINDAHTGAVATTVATSTLTGRSVTVNVSGATGYVTVTGTNPTTVAATAGAHSITGGGGADTLTFSGTAALVQSIVGGLGADSITLSGTSSTGGAAHIITVAATTDTGVVIGQQVSTAVTAAFTTAGMDKITGLGATATVVFTPAAATVTALVRNGVALGADGAGSVALIVGAYDATAQTFTPSATGTSSALIYDVDGTNAGALGYRAVILVGYVDLNQNDTIANNGVFTSVLG